MLASKHGDRYASALDTAEADAFHNCSIVIKNKSLDKHQSD